MLTQAMEKELELTVGLRQLRESEWASRLGWRQLSDCVVKQTRQWQQRKLTDKGLRQAEVDLPRSRYDAFSLGIVLVAQTVSLRFRFLYTQRYRWAHSSDRTNSLRY